MCTDAASRMQYHYSALCQRGRWVINAAGPIGCHGFLGGRYVDVPNCWLYDGSVRSAICDGAGGFHFCHRDGVDAVYRYIYGVAACRNLHAYGERYRFGDNDDTRCRLSTTPRDRRVLRFVATHGRFRRFSGTGYRRQSCRSVRVELFRFRVGGYRLSRSGNFPVVGPGDIAKGVKVLSIGKRTHYTDENVTDYLRGRVFYGQRASGAQYVGLMEKLRKSYQSKTRLVKTCSFSSLPEVVPLVLRAVLPVLRAAFPVLRAASPVLRAVPLFLRAVFLDRRVVWHLNNT